MKRRNNNNNRRRNNRRGRRGGPSEGNGRYASTIVTNLVEVPVGVFGAQYTVEEFLRKYFQEERMVKINKLIVKIQPLDQTQSYYQVQSLITLDEPGTPLIAMTPVIQGSILSKRLTSFIAQPRRFWVLDKRDDFTFLDLRFQTFVATKLIVEIQTFFNIEIDELTPLSHKEPIQIECQDEADEVASQFTTISLANKPRYPSKQSRLK